MTYQLVTMRTRTEKYSVMWRDVGTSCLGICTGGMYIYKPMMSVHFARAEADRELSSFYTPRYLKDEGRIIKETRIMRLP